MNYFKSMLWAFTLKCPRCQKGPLFQSFGKLHNYCPQCDLILERHDDLGGPIVINYSFTVVTTLIFFFIVFANDWFGVIELSIGTGVFALLFMIVFFPYAKSLWVNFLYQTKTLEEYQLREDQQKSEKSADQGNQPQPSETRVSTGNLQKEKERDV